MGFLDKLFKAGNAVMDPQGFIQDKAEEKVEKKIEEKIEEKVK